MHVRYLGVIGALALAGCATHAPTSIPTSLKTGQSWVIDRESVADDVLDTCARDSPGHHMGEIVGYWAPTRDDIEQLEAHQSQLQPTIVEPTRFDRQYVGLSMADGRHLIYLNAFRPSSDPGVDPSHSAVNSCDAGPDYWGAVYDPSRATFSDIAINGTR